MNRRQFVLRSLATVGAVGIGWTLLPPRSRLSTRRPLPEGAGEHALNGWVKIGADNHVTVIMAKSEMGQGVHTALAMLLADELDADWSLVRTEMSPIDPIYNKITSVVDGLPFHPDDHGLMKRTAQWLTAKGMREAGLMLTGGSSSMKDLWLPMRQAGASARAMLLAAAAEQWKVPVSELTTEQSTVIHASGKRATYGALIEGAASQSLNANAPLKAPGQFRIIGTPIHRRDGAEKAAGSATFGLDVIVPKMRYASVRMCPTIGGTVRGFDASAARALPGVTDVFVVNGYNGGTAGMAVIAALPHQALNALKALEITWDHGAMANVSSADIMQQLARTLDDHDGHSFYSHGDVDAALASATQRVQAEYRAPYLAHATMEPISCTVQVDNGRATVWAATQAPDVARRAVSKAIELPQDAIDMRVQLIGGGFGRRLDVDFIAQAAAIANHAQGVPVQTFWSREEDIQHDFYRPACVARFSAGLDAAHALVAWKNTSAGQAIVPQIFDRYFGLPARTYDKSTSEGAFDQPYEYPTARIAHEDVTLPVPIGYWRSVGHSHQAFFKECFMDEVAHAAGADPVAFRLGLLTSHPRHAHVLQRVAALSHWNTPLAQPTTVGTRIGRGVALHQSFGSIVAQVAEVAVDAEQQIRVMRVYAVVDCGFPVNPNIIRQQMEGGIVFGLSAALRGEITIVNGQVQQHNFHDYAPLRIDECPVIETEIVQSLEPPEGMGEVAVPPIAPAVANAVFAATGQRLRALPLRLAGENAT